MQHILCLFQVWLVLCSQVSAHIYNETGIFSTSPTDSSLGHFTSLRFPYLVFLKASILNITFDHDSSIENVSLILYQRGLAGPVRITPSKSPNRKEIQWQVPSFSNGISGTYALRGIDADISFYDSHPESFWSPMFTITSEPGEVNMSYQSAVSTTDGIGLSGLPTLAGLKPTASAALRPARNTSNSRVIGMAVGISLVGVGLLACILFVLWRRKQKKDREKKLVIAPAGSGDAKAKGHIYELVSHETLREPSEMDGSRNVGELSAERELPRVGDLDELVVEQQRK